MYVSYHDNISLFGLDCYLRIQLGIVVQSDVKMVELSLVNMVGTLVLTSRIEIIFCTRVWHRNEECKCGSQFIYGGHGNFTNTYW